MCWSSQPCWCGCCGDEVPLTLPRIALSAVASVVVLVVAGAASYAVWRLALLIDPAQASAVVGEPYRPVLYRLAMLLAGLAVVLSVFALVRRWLGAVGLAVGMLVVLALAGVLLAFTLPGISGAVVQPALVVATGAVVAVLLPERRTAARSGVYLLALAVAAIMLGPAIWIGFDIGLSAGPLSAVLLAMFVTLTLPLIEAALAASCRYDAAAKIAHGGGPGTARGVDRRALRPRVWWPTAKVRRMRVRRTSCTRLMPIRSRRNGPRAQRRQVTGADRC